MSENGSMSDVIPEYSIMEKVQQYGYNHLVKQEQLQLALELIGFNGKNPGFRSLRELFDTPFARLKEYFSTIEITKLKTIRELSAEYLKEDISKQKTVFDSPRAVRDYLKLKIGNEAIEQFVCLFADAKMQLIDCKIMYTGTVDKAVVFPREIIKEALKLNASSIILAHNHPTGISQPSANDIHLTDLITKAAKTMDIKVLDHMIVGTDDYFSFTEESIMEEHKEYSVSVAQKDTSMEKTKVDPALITFKNEKTLPLQKQDGIEYAPPKLFINGINKLKEDEKNHYNSYISAILGSDRLKIDDLPNTMYILDKVYQNYKSQYETYGYVDFERGEKATGFDRDIMPRVLDKEIYSFFEKNILSENERKRLSSLVPDIKERQEIFADYMIKKKSFNLSTYSKKEASFIQQMFKKIADALKALLGKKPELEVLFESIGKKHSVKTDFSRSQKNIINASELKDYTSLKGVDMIIGDVNFSKTLLTDLGDVREITGQAVFTNSRISSLSKLENAGSIDLRNSNVYDLGSLSKVNQNVYSNNYINLRKWENIDIKEKIFFNGSNMTSNYHRLRKNTDIKVNENIAIER